MTGGLNLWRGYEFLMNLCEILGLQPKGVKALSFLF